VKRSMAFFFIMLTLLARCARETDEVETQEPVLTWHSSLEDAKSKAEAAGDLILLSFEADWCPWSRLMRESLYMNEAVIESLMSFRCVNLDVDEDRPACQQFGVKLYPTTIVTDAYGAEIGRMVGYYAPEEFLEILDLVKLRKDRLAEMFKKEETLANDPAFLISFGKMLLELGMYDGALIRFDRATQIDHDDQLGTLEESTYSLAEAYMISGEYREAGRRFRLFTRSYPNNERYEDATILAALCYQEAGYPKVAIEIYESYLQNLSDGRYGQFVRSKLESLRTGD
jgi:thioredoxin-related protein